MDRKAQNRQGGFRGKLVDQVYKLLLFHFGIEEL